jgi:magnesium chelatase family protein
MLARIFSCAVIGLEGVVIEVEVGYTNGLPGMPLWACLISQCRRVVSVANRRQERWLAFPASSYRCQSCARHRSQGRPIVDLPIALGVIVLAGFLPHDKVENTMVIGELSLDGAVRHARGVLPMAATARANGFKRMFVPEVDAREASLIPDLEIIPSKRLRISSTIYRVAV